MCFQSNSLIIQILCTFLFLITFVLANHSPHHSNPSNSNNEEDPSIALINLLKSSLSNENKKLVSHPECMKEWINKTISKPNEFFKKVITPLEKYFLNSNGQCNENHHVVITGNKLTMASWFVHFPHFAEVYFRYYSILLWQETFYPNTKNPQTGAPCIKYLMVNSSNNLFWKHTLHKTFWNHEMITRLNHAFGYNTLISNTYPPEYAHEHYQPITISTPDEYDFLHPSDAMVLTGSVLQKDPCEYHKKGNQLLTEEMNMLILNRPERGIMNIQEVRQFLQTFAKETSFINKKTNQKVQYKIKQVTEQDFNVLSFQDQAKMLNKMDIVFGVHGAAFTNIVFMKPCSVLIEVLPWLFHGWKFFHRFTNTTDLLHYEWMEGAENSVRYPQEKEKPECVKLMEDMKAKSLTPEYSKIPLDDIYSVYSVVHVCMTDMTCSICSRSIKGIQVSIPKLQEQLQQSITDRFECLKTHPFYN